MKNLKIFAMLIIALVAMTGCKDDDDPVPASPELIEKVHGHWYAEIPVSGQTLNWRTEEEGDMASYNMVAVVFYLNGYITESSFWGDLYLQDSELVNFDGLLSVDDNKYFNYTMDSKGNITPSSHMPDAPEVSNMKYDSKLETIVADVSYKGQTFHLTFRRPTGEQEKQLNEYFEMLAEAGEIGGYEDDDSKQKTDVTGKDATEPSRAKRTWRGEY